MCRGDMENSEGGVRTDTRYTNGVTAMPIHHCAESSLLVIITEFLLVFFNKK